MTAHPINTEALRRLADQATPGPWNPHPAGKYVWTEELGGIIQNWSDDANAVADMEFIAAARTAVPALLDLLARWERRSGGHIQVDVDEWCDENDMLHMDLQAAVARAEAAEHRATRAEAQSEIRGRAVVMYRERAREAEARIEAVRDVHRKWTVGDPCDKRRGCGGADCAPHVNGYGDKVWRHWRDDCAGCAATWSCPTIRALDGTVTPPDA